MRITTGGDVKLTGFCFASLYSPDSYLDTFCGSGYFPAPEMIEGKRYIGPEIDVWGLGVVIYIMVCGRVPWDSDTPGGIHQKIKKEGLEFPRRVSSGELCVEKGICCVCATADQS